MSRDHMLAAIITPAAKPSIIRCSCPLMPPRSKNTMAAPREVIKKVKPVPPAAQRSACIKIKFLSRRRSALRLM